MTLTRSQSALSPEALQAYRRLLKIFTDTALRVRGLMFSVRFRQYLSRPMAKAVTFPLSPASRRHIARTRRTLLESRERLDPLVQLFRAWATAELTPVQQETLEVDGEVVLQQAVTDRPQLRRRLFESIKELSAVLVYKHTVSELVALAALGDDNSLLRLVELDKIFLTSEFVQKRIKMAQAMEDREFFARLSGTLLLDTYRDHQNEARLGIACYLLWFLGFERRPKKELFAFMRSEGLVPYRDPESFNRMLTRIGLRRYAKVGHRRV